MEKSPKARIPVAGFLLGLLLLPSLSAAAFSRADSRLDINTATYAELMQVHGMTPVWARRILRFRPYTSRASLTQRGIVTQQEYDRIRDQIIVHRPSRR